MKKAELEYWNPRNAFVKRPDGSSHYDANSYVTKKETIEDKTEEGLFIQFYKKNNQLRYCNGSYYTFADKVMDSKYREWLKSDSYKSKSFELYYGNGVVD